MDSEPGEFCDFPEPNILVNDDVAHPLSSPMYTETVNRALNDFPGTFDSNITFESAQSDIDVNNIETENDKQVQECKFDNQENSLPTNTKSFDLNEKFKYLQMEYESVQRVTTHFEK